MNIYIKKLIKLSKDLDQKYNHLLFYLLLVLAVFIPLYPKLPLSSVAGTYVAIRLEDALILVIFLVRGVFNLHRAKKMLSKTITQSFILFWVIGLISLLSAFFITLTVSKNLGILHLLRRVEVMMLFFVAATTLRNINQLKIFLYSMLVVTAIVVFYGLGQIYAQFPVISTTNREFSKGLILTLTPGARPNSTFAGHYDLAAYLSIAIIFIGTLFFYRPDKLWNFSRKIFLPRLGLMIVGLSSFALLGLTAARVSFVAVLAGLVLSFWLNGKKVLIFLLILASIGAVGVIPELRHRLVATVTVNFLGGGGPKYEADPNAINDFTPRAFEATTPSQIEEATETAIQATPSASKVAADIAPGEPTNSTELGVYRSFNIRTDVEWPRALRAFYKNPILGTGYSSITLATDNDYLRSLGEVGVFGTLSFGLIFFILIKKFIKSIKKGERIEKLFIIATLCSIFAVLITAVFIDILEASKIASLMWIMLGLAWAISNNYSKDL